MECLLLLRSVSVALNTRAKECRSNDCPAQYLPLLPNFFSSHMWGHKWKIAKWKILEACNYHENKNSWNQKEGF